MIDNKLDIDRIISTKNFKNPMGKAIILLLFGMIGLLLSLSVVVAAPSFTFKKYTSPDLKISCFDINNSLCNSAVDCYITISDPDGDIFVNGQELTYNTEYWNITLPTLEKTGIYPVQNVRCVGNTTGFSTFTFEVTPTGRSQTSLLDNPMILILGILALMLVGMGVYFTSPGLGFLGSLMFIMGGIYTMIYGFNNVTDIYTRSIAGIFIGLGFIFMFLSAYEWIWVSKE